jgi:WD40 repeat protein
LNSNNSEYSFLVMRLAHSVVLTGGKKNELRLWNVEKRSSDVVPIPTLSFSDYPQESAGIHFIETNPQGSEIATGGSNPAEIIILDRDTLQPKRILSVSRPYWYHLSTSRADGTSQGHKDWVFASAYLNSHLIASGSRDGTVKLWSTKKQSSAETPLKGEALITRKQHNGKVRDLKYNSHLERFATISNDHTMLLWSISTFDVVCFGESRSEFINTVQVADIAFTTDEDPLCMAICPENYIIAVGAFSGIDFYCMKTGRLIGTEPTGLDSKLGPTYWQASNSPFQQSARSPLNMGLSL